MTGRQKKKKMLNHSLPRIWEEATYCDGLAVSYAIFSRRGAQWVYRVVSPSCSADSSDVRVLLMELHDTCTVMLAIVGVDAVIIYLVLIVAEPATRTYAQTAANTTSQLFIYVQVQRCYSCRSSTAMYCIICYVMYQSTPRADHDLQINQIEQIDRLQLFFTCRSEWFV